MNKARRILALVGIIILAGLYITTLILSLSGSEKSNTLFMASICATIIVPLMIWILTWMYNLYKKHFQDVRDSSNND